MIRVKGTIVAMGATSGALEPFNPRILIEKNVKFVYPSYVCITRISYLWIFADDHPVRAALYLRNPKDGRQYIPEALGLIADGVLKPVISKEYPLTAEGVAQAQRDQIEGRSVGKILIKVAAE